MLQQQRQKNVQKMCQLDLLICVFFFSRRNLEIHDFIFGLSKL